MTDENKKQDADTPEEELVDQPESSIKEEEVTPLSVAEAEINDLRDKLLRAVAEAENVPSC